MSERIAHRSGSRCAYTLATALALTLILGCSQGPQRVAMPDFDPKAVTGRAFQALDGNADGLLDQEELTDSPGLLSSMSVFDSNRDQQIARDELQDVLLQWRREKSGLLSVNCEITWKGKPLEGATVRLVPEPFFGNTIAPATAQTDQNGQADLACDKEHLPESLKSLRAVQPGIYRVEVTHPTIELPAEYNTGTRIGRSVSLRNTYPLTLAL